MALNYSTAVKNSRLTAVSTAIGTAGKLVIGTSALSGATGVLAEIPFANPAFNVSAGAMTVNSLPRTVVATGVGVAAKAEFRDSTGVVIASGLTVGLSGTDVIINATSISVGQTVQCTVGTITHAA